MTYFRCIIVCVKGSVRSASTVKKAAGRFHLGRLPVDVFYIVASDIWKNLKNKIKKERKRNLVKLKDPNISKTVAAGLGFNRRVLLLSWRRIAKPLWRPISTLRKNLKNKEKNLVKLKIQNFSKYVVWYWKIGWGWFSSRWRS